MMTRTAFAVGIILAVNTVIGALLYADRTLAQPVAQMSVAPRGPMMGPRQQMPMGQMQQHMNKMTADLRAMRAQLDKVNPDSLTPQERQMYEYLKLLQRHMETMLGWMGTSRN